MTTQSTKPEPPTLAELEEVISEAWDTFSAADDALKAARTALDDAGAARLSAWYAYRVATADRDAATNKE